MMEYEFDKPIENIPIYYTIISKWTTIIPGLYWATQKIGHLQLRERVMILNNLYH